MTKLIEFFNRSIDKYPENAQTWYYKGLAITHLSKYKEAIKNFDKALEINPNNVDAWNKKGYSLYN